ncbi:MAG: hypothetical protein KBS85_02735 [Lachnospiraceae bacterium]|nr:hypothetical protein [Candidatus Merdinaster equi]
MAITPLEQYGTISRTQDFSVHRGQEDAKENAALHHTQIQTENKADEHLNQVRSGDQAQLSEKQDSGSSGYAGDGGRNRKKKEDKPTDGKVVLKGMGSFDMKI